jgi:hypothetical protein
VFVARRKDREREAARRLRREGLAVGRIARELGVAKSSVSLWVRGVPRGGELPAGALPMPAGQRLPVWTSGVAQRCGRCELVLPDVCFNRHGTRRQWWCRECFRAYFRARGTLHRDQSSAALSQRRRRAKAALRAHLRAHPCADCGERDIVVLECDHVRGKRHGIAGLVATGAPLATLREELARCEVVCVNCHRRRTTRRAGWRRGRPDWERELVESGTREDLGLLLAYRTLASQPCADCGLSDLVVMEFDHVRGKRDLVTRLATQGHRHEAVAAEIARCDVVCANCHRRRTMYRGGHHRVTAAGTEDGA